MEVGARLQCAEGKVARGSVKGAFRGVQEVVGGMRRRRRVVVRWRGERERCIFLVVVVVGGGGGGVIKTFMLVQRKSMSREIYIRYIYIYISPPPQKLLPKKSEHGSKFCVMTFFFGWVEPKVSIGNIDYIS